MSLQCLGISDLLQSPSKGYFDSHPKMRVSHKIETRVHLLSFAPPPPPQKKKRKEKVAFVFQFIKFAIFTCHVCICFDSFTSYIELEKGGEEKFIFGRE